jgi:hypothetical protein
MSPEELKFLIEAGPLASVVIVVVVLFLKYITQITTNFAATTKENTDMFMEAIKVQREQNLAGLAGVAKQVRELGDMINLRLGEMKVAKAVDHQVRRKE